MTVAIIGAAAHDAHRFPSHLGAWPQRHRLRQPQVDSRPHPPCRLLPHQLRRERKRRGLTIGPAARPKEELEHGRRGPYGARGGGGGGEGGGRGVGGELEQLAIGKGAAEEAIIMRREREGRDERKKGVRRLGAKEVKRTKRTRTRPNGARAPTKAKPRKGRGKQTREER